MLTIKNQKKLLNVIQISNLRVGFVERFFKKGCICKILAPGSYPLIFRAVGQVPRQRMEQWQHPVFGHGSTVHCSNSIISNQEIWTSKFHFPVIGLNKINMPRTSNTIWISLLQFILGVNAWNPFKESSKTMAVKC